MRYFCFGYALQVAGSQRLIWQNLRFCLNFYGLPRLDFVKSRNDNISGFCLNFLWILLRATRLLTHFCYAKTASPQPPRLDFVKSRNDDPPPKSSFAREEDFYFVILSFRRNRKISCHIEAKPKYL
ncbi:hypothetical protein [Campylobacter troglodytis]|uniref:hypothetical protein n=1 Tax=Campylobacter troglodytis TaxID=654363 RepID=UPI0011592499|nr:hypothetical protein [Campylobacter troglodytis]